MFNQIQMIQPYMPINSFMANSMFAMPQPSLFATTPPIDPYFMYNQMLNNILFTNQLYNGWNNIPLFDTNFNLGNIIPQNQLSPNMPKLLDKTDDTTNKANKSNDNSNDIKSPDNKSVSMNLIKTGYDRVKGIKLANIAKKNKVGFTGNCATYAKRDIQKAGLGKYEIGNATDCDKILDKNPNFKRVEISLEEAKKTPGIVLIFKAGVAGYHKKYGHMEITGGDGCAYSDGQTRNIRKGYIAYAPV